MPIFGSLQQIDLARLLRLLADGRKSGVLTIRTKGSSAEAVIHCGRLLNAHLSEDSEAAPAFPAGKMAPEDHKAVTELAQGDEAAAALFAEFFGLSDRVESIARMRQAAVAALSRAKSWPQAEFRFETGSRLPITAVSVGLPLRAVAERLAAPD